MAVDLGCEDTRNDAGTAPRFASLTGEVTRLISARARNARHAGESSSGAGPAMVRRACGEGTETSALVRVWARELWFSFMAV
jgi:hypothetical protein